MTKAKPDEVALKIRRLVAAERARQRSVSLRWYHQKNSGAVSSLFLHHRDPAMAKEIHSAWVENQNWARYER